MLLKKVKKPNGRIFLLFVQGHRENGRPKSRTVKSLGYLDEPKEQFDDLIFHFERIARTENKKTKAEHAPVSLTIRPEQKIDKRVCLRKTSDARYRCRSTGA